MRSSNSTFLSMKWQTRYSTHHEAKKNGINSTNIAVGTIQYSSSSIGNSHAACHVTDNIRPIGVEMPYPPPPPPVTI